MHSVAQVKRWLLVGFFLLVLFEGCHSLVCYSCTAQTSTSGTTTISSYVYPGSGSSVTVVSSCPNVTCPYNPGICIGEATVASSGAANYAYYCYINPQCVPSVTQNGGNSVTRSCCTNDNCNTPAFMSNTTVTPTTSPSVTLCSNNNLTACLQSITTKNTASVLQQRFSLVALANLLVSMFVAML